MPAQNIPAPQEHQDGSCCARSSRSPIPSPLIRTFDAKDAETSFPPIKPLRPPAGAPNIVICMLDDVGFGAPSAFGGLCATPVAETLNRQRT